MQDCKRIVDWFKVNSASGNPKEFQVIFIGKMIFPSNFLVIDNVKVKPKKMKLFWT